jgi:diketogulonate reductase-like aldo/keto reductase
MAMFADGTAVPSLGLGTWKMGEGRDLDTQRDALRLGLDLGVRLIDTAEMYGNGASETLVGEAIAGRRDEVFVVTKVLPSNATRAGIPAACARSLKRLGCERIDLYLLHWRSGEDLATVVEAFERLRAQGDIVRWGVSNFDVDDMDELEAVGGGDGCATNQVLYNPAARGIEFDLLPWCEERRMPVMAYSPVGQGGRMLKNAALRAVAERHATSPAVVAIAWSMRREAVISIPKAADPAHVRQNAAAAALELSSNDLSAIDQAFPPPRRKQPLGML